MSKIKQPGKRIFLNWWGYLVAFGSVALATWLKYLAQPSIIPADVPILYILAIVPTAVFFGFGPSFLVCILSILAYDFFFIPPLHTFINVSDIRNAPILVIFLLVGVLFSYLASNLRRKNKEAAKEITARKQSEAELSKYRDHLEELVQQRTSELEKANSGLKQEISEHEKAKDALKESENLIYAFFDSPGVMRGIVEIVDDTTVRHIMDNQVKASFMGLTSEALRNKLSSELGEPPEIICIWVSHYKQSLQIGKPVNFEYQEQRGSRKAWLSATVSHLRTAVSGQPQFAFIALDITERKQLEKDLADYRDKLEERVAERTAEKAKMNERLEILSHRLIEIQEEERGNIARELHDQIGQSLSIVKMLMDRASVSNDKEQQSLLGQARSQLSELIDQVSTLSLDLRPKILDDLGLVQALEWYFDRFTARTSIRVQFKPSGNDKNLTSQVTNTIYRVVQEALTNVALHAHATMVSVEFKAEASTLQLRIADDGIGFDPAALPVSNSGGIIGMQERINLVGGTLQVQSQPDAGTRLVADIPYQI